MGSPGNSGDSDCTRKLGGSPRLILTGGFVSGDRLYQLARAAAEVRTGVRPTAEPRARISARMRERAKYWAAGGRLFTPAEDRIFRTHPPAVAARKTGRTLQSVYSRRTHLVVSNGRAT